MCNIDRKKCNIYRKKCNIYKKEVCKKSGVHVALISLSTGDNCSNKKSESILSKMLEDSQSSKFMLGDVRKQKLIKLGKCKRENYGRLHFDKFTPT